jgi:hypothetical protein
MKAINGKMNIDFEEVYDQESDVYYVSFKTGEPSYAVEVDDVLILDVGLFTEMPTGFRILNYKKNPVQKVAILNRKVKKAFEETGRDFRNRLRNREHQVEQGLEKVLTH